MATTSSTLARRVEKGLLERNEIFGKFFSEQAEPLAAACREMSERFLDGGRLLAFGRGSYATDAQHVSVEFVHPVIVGKRALPALDLSILFGAWVEAIVQPEDIAMGFGPPGGDAEVEASLNEAHRRGAMTFALPGTRGSYAFRAVTADPFIHQEMIEILYHTLVGNRSRVLRAARIGPRRGRSWFSVSVSGAGKTADHGRGGRSSGFHQDEGGRRREAARASSSRRIRADRACGISNSRAPAPGRQADSVW